MRLGEGRQVALAAEAVALLEQESPGPSLVAAYTQLANAQWIVGAYAETIRAAEQAVALAERLGLQEPARALGYRGFARAYVGDSGGLAEMERALTLLLEEGAGRDAAILTNNLAVARYPLDGPALALAAFEEGIAFCEQRGLVEAAAALAGNCPGLLAELGRSEEALERAGRVAAALEASAGLHDLTEVRAVDLAVRLGRGEQEAAPAGADWLVETARAIHAADISAVAFASAAAALVSEAPERACALLDELEQGPGRHETPYYARQLPTMVRTALTGGDRALAQRLVDGLTLRYPLDEHAACAAGAQLAEHAGEHARAAMLYAEAAEGWEEFGHVPERAEALVGEGRCLLVLGRPGAEQPLRKARDLFAAMGYTPALVETEALLEQIAVAS